MNSESVDLIYLDPPFNSNHNYAAPIGSQAAGAEFRDTWGLDDLKLAWHAVIREEHPHLYEYLKAVRGIHGNSMMAYLIYMAMRIMEMMRLMRQTASIYLHCDPYASHYLKLLMDSILEKNQFRNEIIWCYSTSGRPKRFFASKHDVILFYTRSNLNYWGNYRVPITKKYLDSHYRQVDSEGRRCRIRVDAGKRRIYYPENGMICNDWWSDIHYVNSQSKKRTGYPTQKPVTLIERIIEASGNGIVLDPFCGCASACIAAEQLSRQWVGIDISPKAAELVKLRMKQLNIDTAIFPVAHETEPPMRTDNGPGEKYNSNKNRESLYAKQSGRCNGCQDHFNLRNMEVDHKIPKSKGGSDGLHNLQLLCNFCNRVKGNRDMVYLRKRLNESEILPLAAG